MTSSINSSTASLPRPKTPSSDLDKGLKAWASQVLAKRRRNLLMKRRSSTASSGETSSMKSTDKWGPAPRIRKPRKWLPGTEWDENPEDDPYTPDRWDEPINDQDRSTDPRSTVTEGGSAEGRKWAPSTKWNEDPKDDPYEVDQWDDTSDEGESGPDGPYIRLLQ
ncbi:uncharacterized protein BT62DRAFT_916529 [Guyanagaster necrorhizus]|uniref:Uncharacterized protein n=1 Tax=Guyanagaster necrorhizus TaxID=856835 RepID=A0A9P8AXN3_9AGAR|nr:uncharacterized protein BT62DRAFT_916529 [Guyanagaster necrorhizus MCA 3950]KAG7451550.1 hypothetical protein BT62DRAFT_916529 [Guyanagaster necrorhizus MCA 3950]